MPTTTAVQCLFLLSSYLLILSEDDDEIEIALSIILLCKLIYIHYTKLRRRHRRGPYIKDRTFEGCNRIMRRESERTFKSFFRVNRSTFSHLLDLIKHDTVFQTKGKKPQIPVKYQLAAFLGRFGVEVAPNLATTLGVSEGTVYHASARVIRALRRIRPQHLYWPKAQACQVTKLQMQELGFPGAVGVVDGTLIPLKNKPRKNPLSYYSRKKNYALTMQTIVDFNCRFLLFDLGWPGCTNDTTVWKMSDVWRRRHRYLAPDEWIMADKVRPFSTHDLTNDPNVSRARKQWNKAFSSEQVVIERTYGRLKGRFPSLRNLPGWNLSYMYRAIEALLIVHNICIDINNLVDDIEDVDMVDDQVNRDLPGIGINAEGPIEGPIEIQAAGLARRKQLVDYWAAHH